MIRVALNYTPRLNDVEKKLAATASRVRNLRPLMQRRIVPLVDRMLRIHWDSKGAAFGHPWAPWAASTQRARELKGNSALGLLRDDDHLFRTLFQERSADSRLQLVHNGLRLQLNVGVPYAVFHQVGTSRMPERQVIPYPFPRAFQDDVRAIVHAYIATGQI